MTAHSPQSTTDTPAVPVVLLVSASWAAPSRPAPTVLKELSRRWGAHILTLLVEDPEDEALEQWRVDVLPTWLRFRTGSPELDRGTEELGEVACNGEERELTVSSLRGTGPEGEVLVLEGPWTLTHRRTGALAKHEVDSEFGPQSGH